MGCRYRLRQGLARTATLWRPPDTRPAQEALSAEAFELFRTMSAADQGHALAVLRLLRGEGPVSPDLSAAALLHDVGKADGGLTLPYRTAIVLLETFWPQTLKRLCGYAEGSWRAPFAADAHHAVIGAERCLAAGCSMRTVALVRYHDVALEAVSSDLCVDLERLKRADDAS